MLPSYCRRVLIALRANAECKYYVPKARKPAMIKPHMSRPMRILFFSFFFFYVPACFGTLGALVAVGARFCLFRWALNAPPHIVGVC